MIRFPRSAPWLSLALAAGLYAAGCHANQNQAASSATATQDQSQDPADANLAPANSSDTTAAAPQSSDVAQNEAPAAAENASYSGQDDADYSEQPVESAPQPPPALPDYQQPPCPGDGYIWTPGYWAYAPSGYYWVPGAWVEPPYQNALWTPGYWGYNNGSYAFYPGHWGTHIGFYGGVDYGFGYIGLGYQGGYWNNGHFYYNRDVNNVNDREVHNVYSYHVEDRDAGKQRVSFNGGHGGVQVRPRPTEIAAWHEPSAPRMTTQVQHAQSYRSNREQFATVNHGHPANTVAKQPLPADHNVRPSTPQARQEPPARQMGSGPGRSEVHGRPATRQEPNREEAKPSKEQKQEPRRPEQKPEDRKN